MYPSHGSAGKKTTGICVKKQKSSVACFLCDKKHACELAQEIHRISTKIELAVRSGMMIDGEYTESSDADRDLIMRRANQLQEQGKKFQVAIKQAKIEVIELILDSFLKGKSNANLCCDGKKEDY
jgi:hypothetical protein